MLDPHGRRDARGLEQLRPLSITYDVLAYAHGSTIFSLGHTKVLCSVMLQSGVPSFLKGRKKGWLTADYTMLPASTPLRTPRDVTTGKKNGRSVEISRLIGRVLRPVVNLDALGENTLFVDCDVLCADGGTRVAALCGSFLALRAAAVYLNQLDKLKVPVLIDEIAAFSLGIVDDTLLVDLDGTEDARAASDFNFVVTRSGKLLEVQGGAEKKAVSAQQFGEIVETAFKVSGEFFAFYDAHPYKARRVDSYPSCPSTHDSLL